MNRQEIDQTCSSSIGFRIRERSSAEYSCHGARAHQAIGSLPVYAINPGSLLAVTIFFNARLLPNPLPASNSFLGKRQNMHQQPPHAPRSPNNRSKSDQRADVHALNTNFGGPVDNVMLQVPAFSRLACREEVLRSL